jgi:branched-chain amino acid transport system permease protein
MIEKIKRWLPWAGLFIALAAIPKLFGIYYMNFFITFAVFAVFSVSLNLLLGYTGLLSFGHAMYFGAGGYGTALALKHIWHLPLIPALSIGVLAAILLALIVCPLVVRVGGTAFAMMHMAFAQLLYVIALKSRFITGGEDGLANFPIPPFSIPGVVSFPMEGEPANFYYFAIIVLGASLWLMWFFTKTPFGQIQVGIRDNAKRIDYLGFKVTHAKAVVYIVSAAFAGVAGSVYAMFQNVVAPDGYLGLLVSFTPIINTMLGGIASFFGPVWGTAIYALIEEIVFRFTDRVELVIGIIFVLVIMYAPLGFSGLMLKIKFKWLMFKNKRMRQAA